MAAPPRFLPTAAVSAQPRLIPAVAPDHRKLAGAFSALVSLGLLVFVGLHFGRHGLIELGVMIPRSPVFWLCFVAYYLLMPLSEWVIYRRLWDLPAGGIGALMRKQVSNELLLGYLGEAQFYAWARSRLAMTTAPFGAIKDVTILSALIGNVVTVVMLAATWPLVSAGGVFASMHSLFISLTVVLVTSFAILLFRQKLFSLPRRELGFIAGVHTARTFGMLALAAAMWHAALPGVAVSLWLVLATLRMLVSRLPLLPNKDAVFAAIGLYVLGSNLEVSDLLTMMAALLVAAHIAVGAVAGLAGVIEEWRNR